MSARSSFVALLGCGLCAFAGLLCVFWVGFLGSDDAIYWDVSTGWLTHAPYIGNSHWSLRHTMVLPIAVARLMLGDGMPALVLPTLLCATGLIVVLVAWTRRVAGMPAAAAVMALVVSNPHLVLYSSTATIDVVEGFFIFSAAALLALQMERRAGTTTDGTEGGVSKSALLLVGALAGLAMISRETTIFAVTAVGLLFLAGYGMERRFYFLIVIGFASIVGLDMAWLWKMTGDPFYRYAISLHHDSMINRWIDQGANVPIVHPLIDPVTMLLLNHHFALLAWIGVPLGIWLLRPGTLSGPARQMAVLIGTLALTWALFAAGLWNELTLSPRYYFLPAIGLSVLCGIALSTLWQRRQTRLAVLLGVLLVSGNLLAMSVDNRNYVFSEDMLVSLAARETQTIHTDKRTLLRAKVLLDWRGIDDRVTSTPPGVGNLFYYNPANAPAGEQPGSKWIVVDRVSPAESYGEWLLRRLVPRGVVPETVFRMLERKRQYATLYRVS